MYVLIDNIIDMYKELVKTRAAYWAVHNAVIVTVHRHLAKCPLLFRDKRCGQRYINHNNSRQIAQMSSSPIESL